MCELVRNQRIGKYLSQISLHKFQRSLIPSFKNYILNKKHSKRAMKLRVKTLKTYPVDLLAKDLDAANNVPDNMILYQITGRKIINDNCDFSSSTDNDGDSILTAEYTNSGDRRRNSTMLSKLYPQRSQVYSMTTDRVSE